MFDPLKKYNPAASETDRVYYLFSELLKNLFTLAAEAKHQKEIIGQGAVCDEMALDFDSYYSFAFQSYIDHGLIKQEHLSGLQLLNNFFDNRSGKMPDFWDDEQLGIHSDWKQVRQMAKQILSRLGYHDLELRVEHQLNNDNTSYSRTFFTRK